MPVRVAIFLWALLLGLHFVFLSVKAKPDSQIRGVLGGPVSANSAFSVPQLAALVSKPIITAQAQGVSFVNSDTGAPVSEFLETTLRDSGNPIGPALYRSSVIVYKVRKGDNLGRIASSFGVSVQTIVNANPKVKAKSLRVGEELSILPVSGVVYKTKDGDSLESIAGQFDIAQDKLRGFNQAVNFANLQPGIALVVPGVSANPYAGNPALPSLAHYFIMPTEGFNWGILHHYNAVDIANSCGTPVVASAEGLVIPDESLGDGSDGWNGGYGRFVLIEHPIGSNVRTRYAHLDNVMVSIGDYVKQGQQIGTMGKTGDATGCHVHFEVYGAENPFAKQ